MAKTAKRGERSLDIRLFSEVTVALAEKPCAEEIMWAKFSNNRVSFFPP